MEAYSFVRHSMAQTLTLNTGQEAAAKGFFEFLLDDTQPELIISGPGGVGKTYLMGVLIDKIIPEYQQACKLMGIEPKYHSVIMTATTNKAAEVLGSFAGRPTQTIHSFLNLTVRDDYATGRSQLQKTANWVVHYNTIVFIDEGSMIDSPLLKLLREGTCNCKLVFVGDHCQLAPVMEPISPIYTANLPFYALTEPMRNNGQPALMAICNQLRKTVETGIFQPIKVVPGVIDWLNGNDMGDAIADEFTNKNPESRILAYTNAKVIQYNDYVREIRQFTEIYTEGEILVNNSAVRLRSDMLRVEEEFEILSVGSTLQTITTSEGDEFDSIECDLRSVNGALYQAVKLPANKEHFASLMKYYSQQKRWKAFFDLKNFYPDLRPRDAATVHKAQGSSYTTVFIDMENISTCRNPEIAARMLYVAFSRARQRIAMYGELTKKFGGIIY